MKTKRAGITDAEFLEQTRFVMTHHEVAEDYITNILKSELSNAEMNSWPERFGELIGEFFATTYSRSLKWVFEYAESPIELMLFNGLLFSSVNCGSPLIVQGPVDDFKEFHERQCESLKGLFECHGFYEHLPEGAKPATFEAFLQPQIGKSDLTKEGADWLSLMSVPYCLLGFVHAFHISLQPTVRRPREDGGNLRADAIVWLPSNPAVRVVIECDGFEHHSSKESFIRDRQRDRWLTENGYLVRRYSGSEIYGDPPTCATELWEYLLTSLFPDKKVRERWTRQRLKHKPTPEVIESWRRLLRAEEALHG